ncbi:M6 family metalloprotease domain-containing protein [bacterium]|nr:M6 family metalloprotease domain-containing protein [bacterium]
MKGLIIFILVLVPIMLFSAYVDDVPMEVQQPNGQVVSLFASGDEFHHRFHDKDGYTITRDELGYYVYAEKSGNDIVPSSYRVGKAIPSEKGLVPNINIDASQWKAKRDEFYANYPRAEERTPTTGQLVNVVIFIKFLGESDFATDISVYDNMLNDPSPNANSTKNYYNEVSYGQLDVSGEFFPPVSPQNTIVAYEDPHPRGYYEAYSAYNTIGYQGGDHGEERAYREHTLLANAAEYVESMIPEDLPIDGDNDGYVDNVIYIIKGSPNNWASLLWPHRWTLYYAEAYIHGNRVWDFNFQLETHLNGSGNSVMCHELYHSLGAPDLYRYETDGDPVGVWDLMAGNTNPPQHMNSYMKYYYTNWTPQIPKIEESGTYSIYPVSSQENHAYRIQSWNYGEDIYFEYRRIDPLFESALPSQGLLVYKINNMYAGEGNAGGPPDEVYIYRPGGNSNGGGSIIHAPFNNNNNHFGYSSFPPALGTNGNYTGVDIYDVVVEADSITFKVDISNIYFTSLNDGQSLISGGMSNISWIRKNNVSNIELAYSTDNGINWQTIAQVNANTGSYNWEIPEINSNEVLLKVTEIATGKFDVINQPLTVISSLNTPLLVSPANNASNVDTDPVISWSEVMGASGYDLEIALDDSFAEIFFDENYTDNEAGLDNLNSFTTYYWRIKATSGNLVSDYSETYSFTTGDFTTAPNSVSLLLPANNAVYVSYEDVEFAWQNVFAAQNYVLQVCQNVYFYNDLIEITDIDEATYTIPELNPLTRYYWRVRAYNSFGSSGWSSINQFLTQQAVSNENDIATLTNQYTGNYPNPFNPETTISFNVGKSSKGDTQQVNARIYNLKGQLVKELVNDRLKSDSYKYTWKGKDASGKDVASGVYYLKLQIGNDIQTGKMVLMK